MNDTGYIPLVDTSRDELRERIGQARERFDQLVRTADPLARPPGSNWTVQKVVAHVLTVAHRYRGMAHGREYPHAANPRDSDVINQRELEAVIAPIPELADQLQTLAVEMDSFLMRSPTNLRRSRFLPAPSSTASPRKRIGWASCSCTDTTSPERSRALGSFPNATCC
jgi:hypothetical protein